jgi:DNA-binding NtrC family response regulator
MAEVLVVDDDPVTARIIAATLRQAGHEPTLAATGAEALDALETRSPDVVCLDLMLPDASGEQILVRMRDTHPDIPVIVLSAQADVARAVDTMKLRPFDYVVKPFDPERLLRSVDAAQQARALRQRVQQLEREVQSHLRFDEIIGHSSRMQQVYDQIDKVLGNRVPVFIHGESGTGKELIARAIHYHGIRHSGPFIAINCGAIAESLQESELFGHERGAFTGAATQYRGRFEQAHGGTLFLDEVGELSPAVQTRLLRVLQEGELQRLGGSQTIKVDVRVISATHRHLEKLVFEGRFREDLFYRLMVFPIEVPQLSARIEDIPLLSRHFARKHAKQLGISDATFDSDAIDVLCRYDWPGNVRELENVIVRTLVSCGGGTIGVDALPPALVLKAMKLGVTPLPGPMASPDPDDSAVPAAPAAPPPATADDIVPLDELERRAIVRALELCEGNMSVAAKRLGLGRATLYRKLAQYGVVDR